MRDNSYESPSGGDTRTFSQKNWEVLTSNEELNHTALKNQQYHNYFLSILNNRTFPNSYSLHHRTKLQNQTKAAETIQSWYRKRLFEKADPEGNPLVFSNRDNKDFVGINEEYRQSPIKITGVLKT